MGKYTIWWLNVCLQGAALSSIMAVAMACNHNPVPVIGIRGEVWEYRCWLCGALVDLNGIEIAAHSHPPGQRGAFDVDALPSDRPNARRAA